MLPAWTYIISIIPDQNVVFKTNNNSNNNNNYILYYYFLFNVGAILYGCDFEVGAIWPGTIFWHWISCPNHLPRLLSLKSSVGLFADDCLLYRTIKSTKDHQLLQEDLKSLEAWANDWGMRFNAKKWYLVKSPPLQNRTHTKSPQH
jgi:hypothetical protein